MTAETDSPTEDRPDRPEVSATGGSPDGDEHEIHDEEDRRVDAHARFEPAAAAPLSGRSAIRWKVGSQVVELRQRAGRVGRLDPVGQLLLRDAPCTVVLPQLRGDALAIGVRGA